MLPVYIGVYIFILAIVWGFFLVARHHSYRFQDFSSQIVPVTRLLFVLLLVLSIFGFLLIFGLENPGKYIEIDTSKPSQNIYY